MERTAHAWVELMRRLGYTHYAAQGGDWGAGITTRMAQIAPEGLAGIHLNWPFVIPAHIPTEGLSADEQAAVASANKFLGEGSGYFRQQATRPQTIGYGLADSAVGQLAWVYEKFRDWTDSHGDPENVRRTRSSTTSCCTGCQMRQHHPHAFTGKTGAPSP
jgi:pimeloyl-ACP methyl ester carboxylesterase